MQGVNVWQIDYPSKISDGTPVYSMEIFRLSQPSEEGAVDIVINIARGVNLPVLAYPVFDSGRGGYPAGGIYPLDVSGGVLSLDWESGFASEVIKRCAVNSAAVSAFNTAGFKSVIFEKAVEIEEENDVCGGPWLIDADNIVNRLGYRLFRQSSIVMTDTMTFELPAAEGVWISDNPFYPPVESGGLLEVTVPLKRKTCFFKAVSSDDEAGAFSVFFDEKRWCWTDLISGASESGRM